MTNASTMLVVGLLACPQDPGLVANSLSQWRARYEHGSIELNEPADANGRFRTLYRGLGDGRFELGNHFDGLRALLEVALERQTDDVATAMLELASVGTADRRIDVARRPAVVRSAAISTLGRMTEPRPIHAILEAAAGRNADDSERAIGTRCAALRALGALSLPVARPTIERSCRASEPDVRLAAVESLHALADPRTLDTVCAAMDTETDPRVAEELAKTAHAILVARLDECPTAAIRRVVLSACRLIGRAGWRADVAAIDLCAEFRTAAAVEPLIRVLERFRDDPQAIDRGELSGLLRHRAHEALKSLTGARIAAEDADAWRAFWESIRDDFVLAKNPEPEAARTSSGFFGIPIVGMRVVFVIDRSGSMAGPFDQGDRSRFDVAARELLSAVGAMSSDSKFSVVTFSNEAKTWRSGFTEPSSGNLSSLSARLRATTPFGGTNVLAALEAALSIRTSRHGGRYDSPVDEIFLLSDGAPSVGVVATDPILARVRELNAGRGVRINTIAFGGAFGGAVAGGLMQELAAQNDGICVTR